MRKIDRDESVIRIDRKEEEKIECVVTVFI